MIRLLPCELFEAKDWTSSYDKKSQTFINTACMPANACAEFSIITSRYETMIRASFSTLGSKSPSSLSRLSWVHPFGKSKVVAQV